MKSEIYRNGNAGVEWPDGFVVYSPGDSTWVYSRGCGIDPGCDMSDDEFCKETGLPMIDTRKFYELVEKAKASSDGCVVVRS